MLFVVDRVFRSLYKISLRCSLVRLFTKSAKSCRSSGLMTIIIRPPVAAPPTASLENLVVRVADPDRCASVLKALGNDLDERRSAWLGCIIFKTCKRELYVKAFSPRRTRYGSL